MIQSIARKHIAPFSFVVLLGCTGVSWLMTAMIAPQVAQAYTARVDISLRSQPEETYQNFVRRAEAVARAAAQRSFDGDILVTDVAVTIIGEHNGAIASVLLLQVSRQNWKSRPDTQYWATYFPTSELLLGFEEPLPQPQPQPQPATIPPPVIQGTPQIPPILPGIQPPPTEATPLPNPIE